MKAKVIFSKFFNPEKAEEARKLLEQLHIEEDNQNDDESLPKIKIITKSINEIPYNDAPECLTMTPLCLQHIISNNNDVSESNSSKAQIKTPFDLQKYGNFFYNLFLLDKKLAFGNIGEEEKERLTKKISYMGGKVGSLNDSDIYYILTENVCENPQHIPLVLPQWIDSLFESSFLINTNRFRVDESEITSANGSPNTSPAKKHILLAFPSQISASQGKNPILKNKNANSQPVNSLKSRSKRSSSKQANKIDSRQMTLNFISNGKRSEKSKQQSELQGSKKQLKPQELVLTSSTQVPLKKISSSNSKNKISRKLSQQKPNDIQKIDNFMKLTKDIKPSQLNQLTVTVEGENNNEDDDLLADNEYGSNDEAIEPEIKQLEKKIEKTVQKHIDQHNQRVHGKLVKPSTNSEDEDLMQTIININNKKKRNEKQKAFSLTKLSMVPSILNVMTEDHALSSDNEVDGETNIDDYKNDKYVNQMNDQWENRKKELIDFSSDHDTISPKKVYINSTIKNYIDKGKESELLNDLTSFSQSAGDIGESQSVYYDREPKKVTDNDESTKNEALGKDPLIDCWETF